MQALGVTGAEIDIRPAANQMLGDIGHASARGEALYDVTFENVQAGLRTDYLFRLANHNGALVVGTGDLSELALGWCTYGVGDHMSHYNPNASVSKTLIQHLIRFVAASGDVERGDRRRSCTTSSPPRSRRNWCRPAPTARSSRPRALSALTRCRISTCTTRPATASRRRRSPISPGTPGTTPTQGAWPANTPETRAPRLRSRRDQEVDARVSAALFRAEPVQALGAAERAEDFVRRLAVAARRLARAVGLACRGLARRACAQRSRHDLTA